MHPVVFQIGSFPIHAYRIFLTLSALVGIWLSGKYAKRKGLDPEVVLDVGSWIILASVFGGRIYYILLHHEEFRGRWESIYNPFSGDAFGVGGFVMYGGFIGALVATMVYFKVKKIPMLPYADTIAPSVGIGIFLTRIGCFLNGCCFGASTDSWCAVAFPPNGPAGRYQMSIQAEGLFPSQLFLSFGGLLIAVVLVLVGRKNRSDGFQFYLMGLLYAILRFFVDFTRYYGENEKWGFLNHNQIISMGVFLIFAGLILRGSLAKSESAEMGNGSRDRRRFPL